MMMAYAGLSFREVHPTKYFELENWKECKKLTPFGQLPVLIVPEDSGKPSRMIAQTGAIARYIARNYADCFPEDPVDAALVDMIYEAGEEINSVDPIVNVYRDEQFDIKKAAYIELMDAKLPNLAKYLGNGPFFGSLTKVSIADFQMYHQLDNALWLNYDLSAYPKLLLWMSRMEELPGVKEYLMAKDLPVDIGTKPMLEPRPVNDSLIFKKRKIDK